MFSRTQLLLKQTVEDVKRFSYFWNIATQLIYIVYLTYAVASGARFLPFNIALLVLSVFYFVLSVFLQKVMERVSAKNRRRVKDAFMLSRRLLQLVIVGTSLYTIYAEQVEVVTISVLFSMVSALCFVANVVIDFVTRVVTSRFEAFRIAFEEDYEEVRPYVEKAFEIGGGMVNVIKKGASVVSGVKSAFKTIGSIVKSPGEKLMKRKQKMAELKNHEEDPEPILIEGASLTEDDGE